MTSRDMPDELAVLLRFRAEVLRRMTVGEFGRAGAGDVLARRSAVDRTGCHWSVDVAGEWWCDDGEHPAFRRDPAGFAPPPRAEPVPPAWMSPPADGPRWFTLLFTDEPVQLGAMVVDRRRRRIALAVAVPAMLVLLTCGLWQVGQTSVFRRSHVSPAQARLLDEQLARQSATARVEHRLCAGSEHQRRSYWELVVQPEGVPWEAFEAWVLNRCGSAPADAPR